MSLQSGKRIHANKWHKVPFTQDIIDQVCTMDEMSYSASLDEFIIPWDEGALPVDKLADTKDVIHDHAHKSEMQDELVAEVKQLKEIKTPSGRRTSQIAEAYEVLGDEVMAKSYVDSTKMCQHVSMFQL